MLTRLHTQLQSFWPDYREDLWLPGAAMVILAVAMLLTTSIPADILLGILVGGIAFVAFAFSSPAKQE